MKTNESGDTRWIELQQTIQKTREAAKTALNAKEDARLLELANWLQQAESLLKRRELLDAEAFKLAASGCQRLNPSGSASGSMVKRVNGRSDHAFNGELQPQNRGKKVGAKARGRSWRLGYVKARSQNGEPLHREKETLYRNPAGLIRGIAYASESAERPGRWFLGLPKDQFQEAALICEPLEGPALQIHLPRSCMDQYGRYLSSAHGQTLFNIVRNAGKFFLVVPNVGSVDLTEFADHGLIQPFNYD